MSDSSKQVVIEFKNLLSDSYSIDDDQLSSIHKIKELNNKATLCANNLIKLFIKKGIFEFSEMISYFNENIDNLDDYMVDVLKVAYVTSALNTSKLTSSLNDVRNYKLENRIESENKTNSDQIIEKITENSNKPKVIIAPDEFKVMRQSLKIHMQENKRGYYLELKRSKELAVYLDKQARYYCEKILAYEKLHNLNSLEAKEIVLAEMLGLS